MTFKRSNIRGVHAPFAALFLIGVAASGAGMALAAGSKLPAPGTYALQRIQRIPDAVLLDADGKPALLSTVVRGAVTALGFFYSRCVDPAGCPVAWSVFETMRKEAASDQLINSKLRLVFVSLDPTHDTAAVMRFLQKSENDAASLPWIFLTSRSQEELAPLLENMGQEISFEIDAEEKRTGVVNHMLKVFLIDPNGWVREIYTTAFLTSESLLNDARTLALEYPEANNRSDAR